MGFMGLKNSIIVIAMLLAMGLGMYEAGRVFLPGDFLTPIGETKW